MSHGPNGRRVGLALACLVFSAGAALPGQRSPRRSVTLEVQDLGTFDGGTAQAAGFNDLGQVVGVGVFGTILNSFLWDAGMWSDIGPGLAVDINNSSQILLMDRVDDSEDLASCYLLEGQQVTVLGTPPEWQCQAADLNDAGQIVGTLTQRGPGLATTRGFLWSAGTLTGLGDLGGVTTLPGRINERGQVAGTAMTPSGYEHAFLWEAGTITDLGAPGAPWSRATALNERGQVVVVSGAHVYLREAGVMRDLGTMGAPDTPTQLTIPLDIDDHGRILVAVEDAGTHVFRYSIWSAGRLTPLPSLGSGQPSAIRLNDRGQAIGNDRPDANSPWHLALFSTVVLRGNRAR